LGIDTTSEKMKRVPNFQNISKSSSKPILKKPEINMAFIIVANTKPFTTLQQTLNSAISIERISNNK